MLLVSVARAHACMCVHDYHITVSIKTLARVCVCRCVFVACGVCACVSLLVNEFARGFKHMCEFKRIIAQQRV